ncbi:NADH-quinone oxidoreductase subunit 1 [Thalassoglobus neptunius]|uniref:NADH-quinone oxidoreductase subunit 1 n=1 Tax=Thalassoglobus neptunius TaxID=1938619 RepID=A0A5C5WYY4_9PLAN|nr:NAD(P)H-dependent oxidoreductase subunit E [Thalassoglobus neptunius]TWT55846.1 NADH-quinone oxidoreductase subunit 1 [Thalassoglobus neptunius]
MQLLRELLDRQHQHGYLSDGVLREISEEKRVPLFRLEELVSFYTAFRRTPPAKKVIDVCRDVCCQAAGCQTDARSLENVLQKSGQDFELREVSCQGRCDSAPSFSVNDFPAAPLTLHSSEQALQQFITDQEHSTTDESLPPQQSKTSWKCDPYSSADEFYSVAKGLRASDSDSTETCVNALKGTNLTGRGGAGFPTGLKWEIVSKEAEPEKYVICNADESEPGTFKDREILHRVPHLVIEGMLLAAMTIGAESGIVYVRHEYGPETRILRSAIQKAYESGILGESARGPGQRFDLEIFVSPGGYILGEETALLEALEDKRGEPRNKPPYPGQHGLWGKPTLINNVETFALVPSIVHNGPEWWEEQGIHGFSGLKFMCVSGDVRSPGVFEVPMGTTFSEVIEMAGGVSDDKRVKAFLPGGASSLFLGPDKLDTPIDFDAVRKAGSMLGTGALMVFHEGRDLYSLATNLTQFFRNESCGKCVPCRIGSHQAVTLLESGGLREEDVEFLGELHETLQETSICGLGQVALAPVLSMLKNFPEEIPNDVI